MSNGRAAHLNGEAQVGVDDAPPVLGEGQGLLKAHSLHAHEVGDHQGGTPGDSLMAVHEDRPAPADGILHDFRVSCWLAGIASPMLGSPSSVSQSEQILHSGDQRG